MTWQELLTQVEPASAYISNRVASNKQEVISLLLTNSVEFVVAYLAILHAGHIAMPIDPAYKKLELEAIISQIPPVFIVTDDRYKDQVTTAGPSLVMFDDLLKSNQLSVKTLCLPATKQIASLTFTSGTTGKPKAAPYTHANHIWNIKVCSDVWGWTSNDSLLMSLPLSHWYGLVMGLSGVLYHGNTLYLTQQSFDAEATLKLLSSGKVSLFTHTPFAYTQMLEQRGKYDLSEVRLFISGGGPLAPEVWRKFKQRFGIEIIETYGSSESGRIAANSPTDKVLGSPGKILPTVKLKLSDEGEVLIRSEGVFPGYYHNSSATRASQTSDGWWRTGDIAELKSGHVYLKGRVHERIRKFSYTISPRDVEWVLHQHSKISDVFVLGQQISTSLNDKLVYFIVGNITEAELTTYCKENMLFAWRPDRVIWLDKLPRTTLGKPKIPALKKLLV